MRQSFLLRGDSPDRFCRYYTHAEVYDDGTVAVGVMSRTGLRGGHFLWTRAISRDLDGVMTALAEEDEMLAQLVTVPLSRRELEESERLWPGTKRELRRLAAAGKLPHLYTGLEI